MTISIVELSSEYAVAEYDVRFFSDSIKTTVTHDPQTVTDWLSFTEQVHRHRLHHLIVGLDAEWRPSYSRHQNRVAILQICVGHRCLVFQILQSEAIPDKLREFLANVEYTFVGVGINNDIERLEEDHEIFVHGRIRDLGQWAADTYDDKALKKVGLKDLATKVLEKSFGKPKWVTMSRWDNMWLTPVQVQYACVDAFVSFEIGRLLNSSPSAGCPAPAQ